ncbi:serine O-acetyltransferase EpsC [Halodesulfovibrio marinisediminis]|uniref:Serine O-acetyltransferase n=1 Tax=Halodesulfovibrio marinisediminis DSM 17456 TaxID=1121457 RepID=A0A1N6FWU7_9BACT|nr:serine O-acetyltransferase EpsC [Halodesulfovibrio marinisediminis]SIN99682.1 serine O-acetyltransferase [Halodesulfovibrio marinisediminis DSM 17456]
MQRNYAELEQHNMTELDNVVEELCAPESYAAVYHRSKHDAPMPSTEALLELVERLKAALFPGYFGDKTVRLESMRYHLSANLDSIYRILAEQIKRGGCFICAEFADECTSCEEHSRTTAMKFVQSLPKLRRLLASDVKAAFEGDPAAKTPGETIFCYPSITAMIHHRIAHELYRLEVPIIPRIISEMAHSNTGIDIHPGAQIGEEFFIDHGTGVVIGETCIIGKCCRLYQGVTLGALSFPKDSDGLLVKGNLRHPILEDNVTVYAGATVLGRITIGHDTMIGGNVWITHDVEPNSKVVQSRTTKPKKEEKLVGEKA